MNTHEQMIIGSLRYALGRSTYVVSSTVDYIKNHSVYSKNFLHVAIEDIERELKKKTGMECDRENWEDLLYYLKSES